jgi:hypothetical protein
MKLKTKRKTKFSARDAAKISKVVRDLTKKREFADCGNDRVLAIVFSIETEIARAAKNGQWSMSLSDIWPALLTNFSSDEIDEAIWIITKQGYWLAFVAKDRPVVFWGDGKDICQERPTIRKKKDFVYR